MILAHIVGAWTAQRTPQLLVDYPHPSIAACHDVTGTDEVPPDPNLGVWEVTAEQVVIDVIIADGNYCVLWAEDIIENAI